MYYFCDLNVYNKTLNIEETLRFCTSSPSLYKNDIEYHPRVTQPAIIERAIFVNGKIGGGGDETIGAMTIDNIDGKFDYLANGYSFGGRQLTGYFRDKDGNFTQVHQFIVDEPDFTATEISFPMRDRRRSLQNNLQQTTYGGTNPVDSTTGVDGDSGLKGTKKPLCYGAVAHKEPVLVNNKLLIYQINDGSVFGIVTCLTGGAYLKNDGSVASVAALEAAAVDAGSFKYTTGSGGTYLKLGAAVSFPLAVSFYESNPTNGDGDAVVLARRVAIERGGFVSGDFVDADIEACRYAALVGLVDNGSLLVDEALDILTSAVNLFWFLGVDNRLRFIPFRLPTVDDVPAVTIEDWMISTINPVQLSINSITAPPFKVSVNYDGNYRVESATEITGVAQGERQTWLSSQTRTVVVEDSAIKTAHLLAQELSYDSVLIGSHDADVKADAAMALFNAGAQLFDVVIDIGKVSAAFVQSFELGIVAFLAFDRFGLDSGRKFIVVAMGGNYRVNELRIRVFG